MRTEPQWHARGRGVQGEQSFLGSDQCQPRKSEVIFRRLLLDLAPKKGGSLIQLQAQQQTTFVERAADKAPSAEDSESSGEHVESIDGKAWQCSMGATRNARARLQHRSVPSDAFCVERWIRCNYFWSCHMKPFPSRQFANRPILLAAALIAALFVAGCAVSSKPKIEPAPQVDLQRFMGDWYVIGNIPTRPERDAFNAVESYTLQADGTIATRFRYREGSFDGELKTMNPVGTVVPDTNNAVWGMQFIWPIKAEYVIVDIDRDYQLTIIGRSDRDYAWIMARTPEISEASYRAAVTRLKQLGYSVDNLRRVPQRWPEAPAASVRP